MAIGGIETLRQLGFLGKANFKATKFLTTWGNLQQVCGIANDSQEFYCFPGLKENKVSSLLMKASQLTGFYPKFTYPSGLVLM